MNKRLVSIVIKHMQNYHEGAVSVNELLIREFKGNKRVRKKRAKKALVQVWSEHIMPLVMEMVASRESTEN